MTRVLNAPEQFTAEAVDGLVSVYPQHLRPVYGGVIRAGVTRPGKVAVVIGGGSGHYPAFAGWVGPGLADGAVVGNIFASPSTRQICSVAAAVDDGAGVLLSYGNYAGDVLNFSLAEERLRADGIEAVNLPVTDDVSSAAPEEAQKRRGVAGDLMVFKIAGAAAEAGQDLTSVADVAGRANSATFSFGVAFAGCTLPGADSPLFTVPEGQMGVGLGVHGEPGIAEVPIESAAALAQRLVGRLLEERPQNASGRVAVLLNGLGGTKYEELFVLWHNVRELLTDAGLTLVRPEVGELITSLDMAGVSLTLTWLDDELEELWLAPADCPAFHRNSGPAGDPRDQVEAVEEVAQDFPEASDESRSLARALVDTMADVAALLHEQEAELGALDAIAGDGDHGRGMTTGCDAALAAARLAVAADAGLASTLAAAGDAWADKAGGTSGALWGNGLHVAAGSLNDTDRPQPQQVLEAVQAARDLVTTFGKAKRYDKTLLDALIPFVDALADTVADRGLADAWRGAAEVATAGADATAELAPKIGRSRVLADRSQGHADPGAVSLALVLTRVGSHLG